MFQTWKYRRRALRKMRESEADGWKAVVVSGVRLMWSEVSSGFGFGGLGLTWCRYKVELGPDERRRGYEGWNESEVTADWGNCLA